VLCGAKTSILDTGDLLMESFPETIKLLDYGFDNFSYVTALSQLYPIDQVTVLNSAGSEAVAVAPAKDVRLLLPANYNPDALRTEILLDAKEVEAPVSEGQKLGLARNRSSGNCGRYALRVFLGCLHLHRLYPAKLVEMDCVSDSGHHCGISDFAGAAADPPQKTSPPAAGKAQTGSGKAVSPPLPRRPRGIVAERKVTMGWEELRAMCLQCTMCPLCQTRHNVVFGVGPTDAEILFVGEGPGEQEDLTGEPFVGPAGKLLDDMLRIIDLGRHNCYIANIVKCRPPHNRDPLGTEQDACIGYLRKQTKLLNPKIIVCLGRIAAMKLIREDFRISRDHGTWEQKGGIWFTAMYHPSALLRDVTKRPDTFRDLKSLQAKAAELCTHTP